MEAVWPRLTWPEVTWPTVVWQQPFVAPVGGDFSVLCEVSDLFIADNSDGAWGEGDCTAVTIGPDGLSFQVDVGLLGVTLVTEGATGEGDAAATSINITGFSVKVSIDSHETDEALETPTGEDE